MSKTKEELNELKEKVTEMQEELKELTPEELEQVFGGAVEAQRVAFTNMTVAKYNTD